MVSARGDSKLAELLLKKGSNQALADKLGRTALFLAVEREMYPVVGVLISQSTKAIDIADLQGRTPLQVTSERGNKEIAELLLRHRADPNKADKKDRTALLLAAENGHNELVSLLLAKDANQAVKDEAGRTALLLGVTNGDDAVVKTLLDHPTGKIWTSEDYQELLPKAVQSGNKEVSWLITQKLHPRSVNHPVNRAGEES